VVSWQLSLRQAMFEALDADSVREIVRKLVERAKDGDLAAARLVLNYAVGGATVKVNNAVIVTNAPLPSAPSEGLPGSDLRFSDMARRAERGQPLVDPRDHSFEDSG
jgi:hypothetical protein